MKKSNIFNAVKELARDVLLVSFMLFIVVFPFALIYVCMWVEQIIRY